MGVSATYGLGVAGCAGCSCFTTMIAFLFGSSGLSGGTLSGGTLGGVTTGGNLSGCSFGPSAGAF